MLLVSHDIVLVTLCPYSIITVHINITW